MGSRNSRFFHRVFMLVVSSLIFLAIVITLFLEIPIFFYDIEGGISYSLNESNYLKITLYRASIGSLFESTIGGNRSYNNTDIYISLDGDNWYYLGSLNITPNRDVKPQLTLRIPVPDEGPFKIFVKDSATESMSFVGVVGPYSADMIYETYLYIGYLIGEIEKSYSLKMMLDKDLLGNPNYIQPILEVKYLDGEALAINLDTCLADTCEYNFTQSNVKDVNIDIKLGYGPIQLRGDGSVLYLYLSDNIYLSILLAGLALTPAIYELNKIRNERKKKVRRRKYRKKKAGFGKRRS